ncbi:MAG: fructose-1,6-bisphosphatase [Candidatus Izemoplasmatales bacterium]|jgi:fructose-1,6-bisphosphatase-3
MTYIQKYLELLSADYPTVQAVSTELINLTAILNLPKGTEVFITDIHGEYDAFNHILKNACGIIRAKINLIFPEMLEADKCRLAFFIYYPKEMLRKYQNQLSQTKMKIMLKDILSHMMAICLNVASKYTKSKVQKCLPTEFAYVIQELLYESHENDDKIRYYKAIIEAIFSTNRQNEFIVQVSKLIRNLAIDRLHIVGDIFDRGSQPHRVLQKLLPKKEVDIQWGNHDIIWMGAACGSELMIANVIRIAARYNNLDCLEDGYGFNLVPLARLAHKIYNNDPCKEFMPKSVDNDINEDDRQFVAKIHKCIAIIQFKLEQTVIKRNPDFHLDDRLLLDKIDILNKTITIDNTTYPLLDSSFPTIDFDHDPYRLTKEEKVIMDHLVQLFLYNDMLQEHILFMFQKGEMFKKYNNNLLFHAAIPFTEEGDFRGQVIDGTIYSGKALFEVLEQKIRHAYQNRYATKNPDSDYFLFLWQGPASPLFGKNAMKTFERYFIADKQTHQETTDPYFKVRLNKTVLKKIYKEFDLDWDHSNIINGHVPHDVTATHEVVLADNRIYSIDGGMSRQYSKETSIGGYTLISDSHSISLVSHERFDSSEELIASERDIIAVTHNEDINTRRTYIYDTDKGKELKDRINDLRRLLECYSDGSIKEKTH